MFVSHSFGLRSDVKDNVWYYDEHSILFPAGHNIVLFDGERGEQKFIPATERTEGISAICLSPNRRYVAVGEVVEKAQVTIFDVTSLKRKKVLQSNDYSCKVPHKHQNLLTTSNNDLSSDLVLTGCIA